jgi:hypothetical protein
MLKAKIEKKSNYKKDSKKREEDRKKEKIELAKSK